MGGTRGGVGASRGIGALLLPTSNLFTMLWGLVSSSCSQMGLAGGFLQEFCQARDPRAIAIEL